MKTEAQKEHQWLQKLVGEWTCEAECIMEPGEPPAKMLGSESVRSLGGLWIVGQGQSEMPGGAGPATSVLTLGYDPRKQRFVGTWIGSMMPHLWLYDGELDADAGVLTLDTEGPDIADEGTMAQYKDVIEFKGDDHRVLTSYKLSDDGAWHQFVTVNYLRKQ